MIQDKPDSHARTSSGLSLHVGGRSLLADACRSSATWGGPSHHGSVRKCPSVTFLECINSGDSVGRDIEAHLIIGNSGSCPLYRPPFGHMACDRLCARIYHQLTHAVKKHVFSGPGDWTSG